jgi:predicted DNA-binding transcriptional regulator AlpA
MSLLTLDDISALLQVPRNFVRDTLVKKPDFPRPCLSLSQKTRRWASQDVQQWLAKTQQRNAR